MRRPVRFLFFVALSVLVSLDPPAAQAPSVDQTAHGAAVFQKVCSSCHGDGGAGGRASSLVDNRRLRALSRSEIESIIRNGMPNGMPPFGSLPEPDLQAVTTFVRTFNSSAFDLQPPGDVAAGESFFRGKGQCATCHIARGQGGAGGPDLSNIGRQMTVPELTRALVEPDTTVAQGYATARVQLKDGRTLRGFVRNEGNHVLPLQTVDGRLVAVDKRTATITRESGSAMPPLKATADETRDLIAFLSRLEADLKVGTTTVVVPAFRTAGADTTGAARGFDEILKPRPGDWPTYHGRLDGNRHSALAQITTGNVRNLALQWIHSVRGFDNEMTPLVLDGIMYITATNQVSAIDAASGREIWRFSRPRSTGLRGDAAIGFNRGAAVLGSRVFLVTDNAHLLAVSRVNGALLWEAVLPENTQQPYGGTMAPLVVGNLVVAGVSGGDEGIRGFLAAYHADTGEQAWRFWTVPARGEPASETWKGNVDLEKGGGATWLTGTYDAETDMLFWPTGNPYPDTDGSERQGDNLYTNSILALEARTGKLRWHYQFTPHDLWDWDAQEPPLLVDAVFQGKPRKLLLQANRNGFFYVLDRADGKVLLARPFVQKLTWASGIGSDGRPQLLPGNTPDENGVTTCPAIRGATNWMSTAFSPATRLFYVMAVENCFVYRSTMFGGGRGRGAAPPARGAAPPAPARGAATPAPFGLPAGGFNRGGPGGGGSMALRALDLDTGRIAWEVPQVGNSNNYAGTLSTAGGLVFYGQASGEFAAVDAKSGAHLWHFETQETWKASPMTYSVNGRQYVAITSGANVLAFALPQAPALAPPSASSFDAVAPAMQAFVAKGEVAGVVTLLATRDKVLHLTAVGSSDLATGRKMRTDDIFWIASMSKPIAAAAIAILVDDGKLSFDDPLDTFLPEFRDVKVAGSGRLEPPSRAVTLRDVLTHVSGLGELTDRAPHLTLAETSRSVAQRPLRFQPGARWAYSTAGFDVLGRVVEVVGGMPFDRFLQTRLFDPLGMKDTSFWIRADTKGRWARSYQWMAPEARLRETAISYLYGTDVDDRARPPLGGAGLFSTATDIARFYQMMLNNGELNRRRILKPATVAELIRKQTGNLAARPGMPWGLGFSVVENPAAMEANSVLSPQSFGHGGAYSTQSWADPTKGLIWIVMFQRNGKGNPDNSDVRMAFQGAVPERYR